MVKLAGPDRPFPSYTCHDPFITTPVIVPYGYRNGCCDCGPEGIPDHALRTHARDAIRVGPTDAGTAIRLDDGTGEGFRCPLPLDCLELRVRFKGTKCWNFVLHAVGITDAGELDIRWTPEWHALPPGYYEALIVFNPHTPVQQPAGWLLFWKLPPKTMRVASSRPQEPHPDEDMDDGRCLLTAPVSARYPDENAECDQGDCGPCQ